MIVFTWVFTCACAKHEPQGTDDRALQREAESTPLASAASEAASDGLADAKPDAESDAGPEDLTDLETRPPVWGKSIGHTSVVFKVKLDGGALAAYKPASHRGGARYKGEIAAYRLARALGLPNVPPALARDFRWTELSAALGGDGTDAGKLFKDETSGDERGNVRGAIIPWIEHLTFVPLDAEPLRSSSRGWLEANATVPDDKKKLAGQLSTMIVFDYLTGNWDRWSGGNIGMQEGHDTLLFIDNDGAFFDPPPPAPLAKQLALLKEDARYSRSFVTALRSLDSESTRAAFGELRPGEPLLSAHVLEGVEVRRRTALAIIEAKVASHGERSVLVFD